MIFLEKIETYIISLCLILLTPPFYLWGVPAGVNFILIFIMFSISIRHMSLSHSSGKMFAVAAFILCILFYLHGNITIISFIKIIFLLTLFFLRKEFIYNIYKSFCTTFSLLIIPSLLEFIIYLITGNGFIIGQTIPPFNEVKEYTYQAYAFMVTLNDGSIFPLFHGYFDERGVIGMICAILLAINNYNLKEKKYIPIFIAGILSLSLYFVLSTIIYFIFFYRNKRIKKYSPIIMLLLVVIGLSCLKKLDSPVLNRFVLNRLEFDENKGLKGNNREVSHFAYWFSKFKKTPKYYCGLGHDAKDKYGINEGGSSYKDLIVSYGIIGFLLYYLIMLLWACNNYTNMRSKLLFVFIFSSLLFQRPQLFAPLNFVLILFMVSIIEVNYNNQLSK